MSTRFVPSPEQMEIITADLVGQRVIACAGSGKTATTVRRLAEVRRLMGRSRQYAVLLSYSNVAVETFRAEYAALEASQRGHSNRVLICTVDSFVSSQIIAPHAASTMGCMGRPYLVRGHEPFLKGFTFFNGRHGEDIHKLSVTFSDLEGWKFFNTALRGNPSPVDGRVALAAIRELGRTGAYTHETGRYWAFKTLDDRSRLIQLLAHRHPYILVDEAQDVGGIHGALLRMLIGAGSTVSLVGDPNQAIYEFANADGSFLRNFDPGENGLRQTLSINRRSLQPIVDVSNKIGGTSYLALRSSTGRKCGAFLLTYNENEVENVRTSFAEILEANGYSHESAALLCRAKDTIPQLSGSGDQWGQAATEHFVQATICRDRGGNIADAFEHALDGVIRLLESPPPSIRSSVLGDISDGSARELRRLIWAFLRFPLTGLPAASEKAKTDWLPTLKFSLSNLLAAIDDRCGLTRNSKWTYSVTSAKLTDEAFLKKKLSSTNSPLPCVMTVHQAKGKSIDAVLYFLRPRDVKHIIEGPIDEEGRIGYVGLTRARDLLLLAMPSTTRPAVLKKLKDIGFTNWS